MAAAFRGMTAALYRRIEASERFAQDVAHELKNPLTAAGSVAQALAYAKSPGQQQELVRQIQEELKRLNKLITDVASASRHATRTSSVATTAVTIRHLIENDRILFLQGVAVPPNRVNHFVARPAFKFPAQP